MKCKQKVNTQPIPLLLTSQQEGIFGNATDKRGKPFGKLGILHDKSKVVYPATRGIEI